jgi:hypothetical protein
VWAVIDTSVYIGHWDRGLYEDALAEIRKTFVIRHSAVVLSELRRGARTREAERTVQTVASSGAGRLGTHVQGLVGGWADYPHGGRHSALGSQQTPGLPERYPHSPDRKGQGARVVTANRGDFEVLGKKLGVPVFVV